MRGREGIIVNWVWYNIISKKTKRLWNQLEFIWEFYNWLHKKYKKEIKLQKLIDLFPIYIKKNHHDDKNKCKISKNELF